MSNFVSILGTKLINLMSITTVEDTDYVIIQKNTKGDQFTRKILQSDYVAEVLEGLGSDDVTNESGVSGLTVTDALNALDVATPVITLSSKADVLANGTLVADEITLNVANYYFGVIDLGSDVIILPGGALLEGGTATLSSITSSSSKPTITARAGGFAACAIVGTGGASINNTGGGAAIRVQDTDTICAIRRLLTTAAGTALEIHDSNVLLDSWTILGAVNGLVMTGTLNSGPIISNFNPIGLTGRGIYINGDITVNDLRIDGAIINGVVGNGVELASGKTIKGLTFTGSSMSVGANGVRIAGNITEGLLIDDANISSTASDGMDITGSTLSTLVVSASAILSIGAASSGLKGDASSANITFSAIITASNIQGIGGGSSPLSGITKKDLNYFFTQAGAEITDSVNLGVFTLDAQSTTTISYQGNDGSVVAFSDPGGGVNTRVDIGAHSFANGTSVSITDTVAYNGLFVMANVTATTFDIVRTFVTAEVVGGYETAWTKINGITTDGSISERFTSGANNNEIASLDAKTIPVIYTSLVTSDKSGATSAFEFALFCDIGAGFEKINGSTTSDISTRVSEITHRVPVEAPEGAKFSMYLRNMDNINDIVVETLTSDVFKV
jgi:hypothetical protein